jgi:hypothetical protein
MYTNVQKSCNDNVLVLLQELYILQKDEQILKEVADTFQIFYPDMFRHMVAILSGS